MVFWVLVLENTSETYFQFLGCVFHKGHGCHPLPMLSSQVVPRKIHIPCRSDAKWLMLHSLEQTGHLYTVNSSLLTDLHVETHIPETLWVFFCTRLSATIDKNQGEGKVIF